MWCAFFGDLAVKKGRLADAMPLILAYHYTRRRTADPMHVFLLVDRHDSPVAAAVFTSPVNRYFGKGAIELARLVRVPELTMQLSSFIGHCLRWLKKNTSLAYCLSYADTTVGHHGGVYRACNFTFVAESKGNTQYVHEATGRVVSGRSFDQHAADNKADWTRMKTGKKLLYIYPLRERLVPLLARFGWAALAYVKEAA
jgi:hypothetical protein